MGERADFYDTGFGIALFALSNVVVFSAVICWIAASLHRIDTERMRAEGQFRLAVESAPSGMVMIDKQGTIILVNSTAEKLFGYSRDEMLGQAIELLVPERFRANHPQDRMNFFADPTARWMGAGRDLMGLRKDGSEFPVEIGLNPIESPQGTLVLSAVVDITDRKRAEAKLRQAHEELESRVLERTGELDAANKELEAFSYSVSHDLRAPLRAIDGFSRILLTEHGEALPAQARDYLHDVRSNTQRMGRLVDDLLAFSRLSRQPAKKQRVSVDRLVDQCLQELAPDRADRQVEFRVGPLPECQGDPALLKQVWINLLSNALKYTSKRDAAVIEIGGGDSGPDAQQTYFIKDNGVGFDMRYADKLFGVFQRMHRAEDYEGTGVGLAIVQRIVHRHGGTIWADAQPNQGATFFFTMNNGGEA